MDDTWNAIGLLVLGWLFGLLSPVITQKIEQSRKIAMIRKGIAAELKELVCRLAMLTSLITGRFGTYTKDHVLWVISVLELSKKDPDDEELLKILKSEFEFGDAEFNTVVAQLKAKENSGLGLKKYQAPYLTAKIGELSLFSESSQRALIEVIANLHIFNEEVDNARYYFNLSYDGSLSPANHAQVKENVVQSYLNVSNRARIVVDAAIEYLATHDSNK